MLVGDLDEAVLDRAESNGRSKSTALQRLGMPTLRCLALSFDQFHCNGISITSILRQRFVLAELVPEFAEALEIAYGLGWRNNVEESGEYVFTSRLTGNQLLAAINRAAPATSVGGVITRLRRYNNALSLVHDTLDEHQCGRLINFSDCEKVGLNTLLSMQVPGESLRLARQYEVLLAPHHGTQEPRTIFWPPAAIAGAPTFPRVTGYVVAQNGSTHFRRQKRVFHRQLPLAPPPSQAILDTFGRTLPITFNL